MTNDARPFILTLALDAELAQTLNDLRTRYFPPERNFLAAHVTLFHALPSEREAAVRRDLSDLCAATPPFGVTLPRLHPWGKGVFAELASPELLRVRETLKTRWADTLTRQDRQGYRPHVTLQNKVLKEEAAALYDELSLRWQPLRGDALGLELWRYAGGPWEYADRFDFTG